jgi:hypothetical protein
MTPLDDELRRTLSSRAATLAPSPDPLAGIEARASRIRRLRVAGAMAGAAVAVAAVALAVPSLVPDRASKAQPGASPAPGAPPANAMLQSSDQVGVPTAPGTSRVVDAWRARHPGNGTVYVITLLDGRQDSTPPVTYAILEVWRDGDPASAVVAQDTTTTPVLVRDDVLPASSPLIDGVVGGSQQPLVVYALADGVNALDYDRGDGRITHVATFPSPGHLSGIFDRTGPDGARDTVTANYTDGRTVTQVVWLVPNDDHQPPANLVSWIFRGDASAGPSVDDLLTTYAKTRGADPANAAYQASYTAATTSGVRYTIGQAWITGDTTATTVSYATGGTTGAVLRTYPSTSNTAYGIAALLTDLPGSTTDLLVVVPRPGVGQVSWSPSSTGAFQPVASGRSDLNGIALIDRAMNETNDRLEVLDGDGNIDHPVYRGPVTALLCSNPC